MLTLLTAGIVLGLSSGFAPGPLLTLVIAQSLKHGIREGVKVASVPLITDLPIILVSTLVLTRLAGFETLLGVISLAGALFVSYLGFESLRTRCVDSLDERTAPQSVARGALVNALSPHPYLFWLTVGVPLLLDGWKESPVAAAGFLAGFYGSLIGAQMLIAVSVGKSRQFFMGKPYAYVLRVLGVLLLVFAALLFWKALSLFGVM